MVTISFSPPPIPDLTTAASGHHRFRRLLVITLVAGIGVMVLSSLLTAALVGRQIEGALIEEIDHTIASLASRSRSVFVVNDEAIARYAATGLSSLSTVRSISFWRADGTVLYSTDATHPASLSLAPADRPDKAMLTHHHDGQSVHVLAPVTAPTSTTPFEIPKLVAGQHLDEPFGYLGVTVDLSNVRNVKTTVFLVHALVLAVAVALLSGWFLRRSRLMESAIDAMTEHLRQAYDAALTADQHKDRFLATVNHELRQPLTSILGYTELALRELRFAEKADKGIERLQVARETTQQMLTVVDQLLAFSKIAAGEEQTNAGPVDIKTVVERAVKLIEPALHERGNGLRQTIHVTEPINTDEGKLFHIVTNLLSNACKFTQQGQINVSASVCDGTMQLVVSDTGIGIAEAHHSLIFKPFQQVDMSNTRQYRGTGIGLAIAQRYVAMLGGEISVKSAPDAGATFTVTLPVTTSLTT
jgi:signal transduction histidine kinase